MRSGRSVRLGVVVDQVVLDQHASGWGSRNQGFYVYLTCPQAFSTCSCIKTLVLLSGVNPSFWSKIYRGSHLSPRSLFSRIYAACHMSRTSAPCGSPPCGSCQNLAISLVKLQLWEIQSTPAPPMYEYRPYAFTPTRVQCVPAAPGQLRSLW
jgi:hypothetical protein